MGKNYNLSLSLGSVAENKPSPYSGKTVIQRGRLQSAFRAMLNKWERITAAQITNQTATQKQ